MAVTYKSYKTRVYHPDDSSGLYNEAPSSNEFKIVFNESDFGFMLINLEAKTYMTIDGLKIIDKSEDYICGENNKYIVRVDFLTHIDNIKKITLTELEFQMKLEYISEVELSKQITAEVRSEYIIGARKANGAIQAYIKEGNFAPIEVDIAYNKIRQKLEELKFVDFQSLDAGEMEIKVSFFKDSSIKTQVDIKNNCFDINTLHTIVEGLYENQNLA